MKNILLVLGVAFGLNVNAQTYVTIPDANFASYLNTIVPSAMNGNQIDTSSILVTSTIRKIDVTNNTISNLKGIQYFKSLDTLIFSTNMPTATNNSNRVDSLFMLPNSLKYIAGDYNKLAYIQSIPSNLTYLSINNNLLISLLAMPASLTFFACENNQLIILPTLPGTLSTLFCGGNQITTLAALPASLMFFSCHDNQLTSLPALPAQLISLYCFQNQISTLPTLPSLLDTLVCDGNGLTSLPALPNSITLLSCATNSIACFPTFPTGITLFIISNNPYNCLPNYLPVMNAADLATPLCTAGNSNGCPVAITGINQITDLTNQISIYPNPSTGNFVIESPNTLYNVRCTLYDVNGRVVLTQIINERTNIDAGNLPDGIYNVSLTSKEGIVNKRLVIVK